MSKRLTVSTVLVLMSSLLVAGQAPASATSVSVLSRNQTISTNEFNTCIISTNSRVKCWGDQYSGDQYSGDLTPITVPPAVADREVESVSTNEYNTCVFTTAGSLLCWGYIFNGVATHLPVSGTWTHTGILTLEDVKAYSTSGSNACVVLTSAVVYCWGFRYSNTGSGVQQNIVPDELGAATSVSTNYFNTCVTLVAGGVTCWGFQVTGSRMLAFSAPSDLGVVVSLSSSPSNSCAVLSTGAVRCWGVQYDGTYWAAAISVPTNLAPAVSVSTSDMNTCVTLVSGPLQCWGVTSAEFPAIPLVVPTGLTRVVGVSTSDYNTCAVKATGSVRCWGVQWNSGMRSSITVPSGMATALAGTVQSPSGVGLAIGQGTLTVSWASVGALVPGNTVSYTASAGSDALSCSTTTLTCDITGLTNGQSYSVTVTASDTVYASVPSVAVTGMPIGPASAPTIASAVTGSGRVTLTIGAPADLGDASLSDYEYSVNGSTSWSSFGSVSGPFVITGLTNGSTYQVKIRAVNSWGVGAASTATAVIPTNLVPTAVSIASATAGDRSVALAITAPTGVTGASVSGYKYSVNNGVSWLTGSVATGVMTITGLHNGVQYSIKVRALNSNGNGLASTVVKAKPCALAGAPTITGIVSGNAKATVSFEEPEENGGAVVSNYQYSLNGGSTWVTPTRKVTRSPLTITGLTNGTPYSIALRAVTQAGSGTTSTASEVTPATVPSAPSVSVSSVASSLVNITLAASSSTGGSAILSYAYTLDNGATWVPVELSAIGSSIAVTGLASYKSYSVKVRATNAAGSSLKSAAATFKTLR